jgi:DNA-binding NarL/FixJ family response regulator
MPPPDTVLQILIVDDHRIFREGLRKLLEAEPNFRVAGEAGDGAEAVRKVRQLRPDLILLDLSMPGMHGLDALRELTEQATTTRILLLTAAIEKDELVTALQLGARGVVMKDSASTVLLEAIHAVMAGQFWVDRGGVSNLVDALRSRLGGAPQRPPQDFGLTARELEVIAAVVAAHSNRDIAQKLSISEKTVKGHLTNVFNKVGVSNRLELALFALHHHLPLPGLGWRAD